MNLNAFLGSFIAALEMLKVIYQFFETPPPKTSNFVASAEKRVCFGEIKLGASKVHMALQ